MEDIYSVADPLLSGALKSMFEFRYDIDDWVKRLGLGRPESPQSKIFNAYLAVLSSEYVPSKAAVEDVHTLRGKFPKLLDQERAHLDVIEAWGNGEFLRAQRLLDLLLLQFPRDLLALFAGHQLDFFLGDAFSLRDRVGGAVAQWDKEDPLYGYLLGMFAFGLEESGWYGRALDVGQEALARATTDVWALHAVVHSHEMQAEFHSGLDLMDKFEEGWTGDNFFKVHNYWHKCLYLLEMGEVDAIFDIYDRLINPPGSALVALALLDASAILWRLYLEGIEVGTRWVELSEAWEDCINEPFYVFNDCHAIMAFVGADRFDLADRRLDILRNSATSAEVQMTNVDMTKAVGLSVAEAIVAFGRGDYRRVIDSLYPIRKDFYRFGGSHAQRDVFHRTLLEAAIRLPDPMLAASILDQRIALKEDSPYNWFSKSRLLKATREDYGANLAGETARSLITKQKVSKSPCTH